MQRIVNACSGPLTVFFLFLALFVAFFVPVLGDGRLLASGDGFKQYLPAFLAAKRSWTPFMFSGYPLMSDPETMAWYPIARVFAPLGVTGWNAFVVLAFALAGTAAFFFVHALTRSIAAATVGGIVYGMSGFYMSHLNHTTFIHGAAWFPLILLGMERLKAGPDGRWLVTTAVAVGLCITGGHPQIWFYSIGFAGLFAVFTGSAGGIPYAKRCGLALTLGVAVAAVQLLPTVELWGNSVRQSIDFDFFNAIHLPPEQLTTLLFPAVFGVPQDSATPLTYLDYFGADNFAELTGYVGILPLMLAAAARDEGRGQRRFWIVAAVLSLLLALGGPLSWMVFHIPIYGGLRAPSRHLLIFSMAASVLAGLGVASLQSQPAARRLRTAQAVIVVMATVIGLTLLVTVLGAPAWFQTIWSDNSAWVALPWRNPALAIPLLVLTASAASLYWWAAFPTRWATAAMIGVIIVDLGSFGWFCPWRTLAIDAAQISMPSELESYRARTSEDGSRLWRISTSMLAQPNLPLLWRWRAASGYTSLELSRYQRMRESFQWSNSRALDLLGVRYAILSGPEYIGDQDVEKYGGGWYSSTGGVTWSSADFDGKGITFSANGRHEATFVVPNVLASSIGIASMLGDSIKVPQGSPFLSVGLEGPGGSEELVLRAGEDTAEWAYLRPDVQRVIKHAKARTHSFNAVNDPRFGTFDGQLYYTVRLLRSPLTVSRIRLRWMNPGLAEALGATIQISKITLKDGSQSHQFPVEGPLHALGNDKRWSLCDTLPGRLLVLEDDAVQPRRTNMDHTDIYENRLVLPHAWIVTDVRHVAEREALSAVTTGRLADGTLFDPRQTALVEDTSPVPITVHAGGGTVRQVKYDDVSLELEADSANDGLLVLSEANYPGWEAAVDGRPARVLQTDYILRGVPVPAGRHRVVLTFRSRTLEAGAAVSVATIVGLFIVARRSRDRPLPERRRRTV